MKRKLLLILWACIFYNVDSFAQLEIICFDVGQGNCTLVLHRNYALKVPPLLVDCGSKSYKEFRGATFKGDQIKKIADAIVVYAKAINRHGIIIVASHADEDHYNWIAEVFQTCKKLHAPIYVEKIFLGCPKALYKFPDFKTFIDNLAPDAGEEDPVVLPSQTNSTIVRTDINNNAEANYAILPALKASDKNSSSLVVLVEAPVLKMLIMGDGTGKTTKHITDNQAAAGLAHNWILHASHHGADTHESNNQAWFDLLKPGGVIFSSGVNTGLLHPKEEVVNRALSALADEAVFYPLYFGVGDAEVPCYAKGSLKYGLTVVQKALRGTLSQGSVTYSYDPVAARVVVVCERPESSGQLKEVVLKSLLSYPKGLLAEDHLTEINISKMGLRDDDADGSDKELLHKLFDSLTAKAGALKKLLLHTNAINAELSITKVIELLKKRISIESVNLQNNAILVDRHDPIKAALGALAPKILL